jgi:predicted MFS family arabinose efflux permease
MTASPPRSPPGPYAIVALCAAIQFLNSVDASMLIPMGPLLVVAIGIKPAHIGYLSAAYMVSACVSGLIGSLILDRFDRRKALSVAIAGLVIGTGLGGLAVDPATMIAARIVAGLFGGPAAALSITVIADLIGIERRGWAMAVVSIGTTVAGVAGIPLSLELALWGGWREPFFVVALLGFIISGCAYAILPSGRGHIAGGAGQPLRLIISEFRGILAKSSTLLAIVSSSLLGAETMMLSVSLAPFFVYNLGYPQSKLAFLWMVGGIFAFFVAQITGRLIDRSGPMRLLWLMTAAGAANTYFLYIDETRLIGPVALFCFFCATNFSRLIILTTVTSMVPKEAERARFMSLLSAAQQGAMAVAIVLAGNFLVAGPDGALVNMDGVAEAGIASAFVAALGATLLWRIMKPLSRAASRLEGSARRSA